MKKLFYIFIAVACAVTSVSQAAVNVKKASSVKTKKADTMESATSLMPTVIGLVQGVQALNTQQQQLGADCAPTSSEIALVNDLVKEWAKISETTASNAVGSAQDCTGKYATFMEMAEKNEVCYELFNSKTDEGTVWSGFPKASSTKICEDGDTKNCNNVSNIYDVFNKISFSEADYTKSEAEKVAKLREKAARCDDSKLKAAKRELYGNFVTQTLGNIGQSSGAAGTASVLEAVSSMGGSGDIKSMLPSLGTMALQGLDK